MRTVLCAGIIVLDEVFQVDRFPQPDAKTEAENFFIVNGGCAANAAVAIERLGGGGRAPRPPGGPPGRELKRGPWAGGARPGEDGWERGPRRARPDARGDRMIVTHRDDRLAAAKPDDPARLVACADVVLADNRFPDFVRPICVAARERGLTVVLDADRPTQMSEDLFQIATHVVFSS